MIIRAAIIRSAVFGLLWWALTEGERSAWTIGLPAVALAVYASLRLLPAQHRRISILGIVHFLIFFLVNSIRSGLQIASLALRPGLRMQPKILTVRLRLQGENARLFLASTLNLLPGTLSIDLVQDCLSLHAIDCRMPIHNAVRTAETRVAKLFGEQIA